MNQFSYLNHQIKLLTYSTTYAMTFQILSTKHWDLDSRLQGCTTRILNSLFFNFLEDKDQKIQD
jgi:hypothetical protein